MKLRNFLFEINISLAIYELELSLNRLFNASHLKIRTFVFRNFRI